MFNNPGNIPGISIIEVVIALVLFSLLFVFVLGGVDTSQIHQAVDRDYVHAVLQAEEGLDVIRTIRDVEWSNLNPGTYGIAISGGHWTMVSSPQETNGYTREIRIERVYRDGSGNITETGTEDTAARKITSHITWEFATGYPKEINLSVYLTDIR